MGSEPTTFSMKCFLLLLLPRYRHHQNIKAYFSSVFLPKKLLAKWNKSSINFIGFQFSLFFPFFWVLKNIPEVRATLSFSLRLSLSLSRSLFPWRSVSLYLSLSLSLSLPQAPSRKKLTFDQNSFKLKILWARPNKLITSKAEAIKPN